MNRLITVIAVIFFTSLSAFNTQYPQVSELSQHWQQAGYRDINNNNNPEIPNASIFAEVNNSMTAQVIQQVINDPDVSPGPNNIYQINFVPGDYLFDQTINISRDYVILKGTHMFRRDEDMQERTVLRFNLPTAQHCISINGKTNVGIEDLMIIREDVPLAELVSASGGTYHYWDEGAPHGNNIDFNSCNNCWVTGVETRNPARHHIVVMESDHIEITGNYFHGSQYHGGGGYGYGVNIEDNSHHCLIENNVFYKNRHGIVTQDGGYLNFFGYNYIGGGKLKQTQNVEIQFC